MPSFNSKTIAIITGLGIFSLLEPSAALSNTVETTRARVDHAHLSLQQLDARKCWARYSMSAGVAAGGMIEEVAFRVPCPEVVNSNFIATLQRALKARGHFDGPVTGRADEATRIAVRAFQKAQGFDSPILTLETAQRLGLVPVDLSQQ